MYPVDIQQISSRYSVDIKQTSLPAKHLKEKVFHRRPVSPVPTALELLRKVLQGETDDRHVCQVGSAKSKEMCLSFLIDCTEYMAGTQEIDREGGQLSNQVLADQLTLCQPQGQIVLLHYSVASYVPEFSSKSKSAHSKKSFLINSIVDSQQSNMYSQSFNKHMHVREKKEVISVQKTFL